MWCSRPRSSAPTVTLLILDGWGDAPAWGGNAISAARTPVFTQLTRTEFHTLLEASGSTVGLPGHEQGNSEVGHLTIGAGRAIQQDRTRISAAVEDGSFFRNETLTAAVQHVAQHHSTLHLVGLTSSGGVHSHLEHLRALLEFSQRAAVSRVVIHAITDGRDVLPHTAAQELDRVRHWCSELGVGSVGSVIGRSYAMDRDEHWDRIERSYRLLVAGEGARAPSVLAAVSRAYSQGTSDEFIEPTVVEGAYQPIGAGDAVILFNFRQDRARQLLRALADPSFTEFPRPAHPSNLFVATMIPYWTESALPGVHVVFPPESVAETLGGATSEAGLPQLRIAETEKYAHVTYFLNGGREAPYRGEQRQLIPSALRDGANRSPRMKTPEIARAVITALHRRRYRLIVANVAAPDMVGHTGDFAATVAACEAVDEAVGLIWQAVQRSEGILVVTADHGNAEQLLNPVTNEPDTHHTTNPVPLIVADPRRRFTPNPLPSQTLADVAPTVLTLLDVVVPDSMTGRPLGTMQPQEVR